MLPIIINKCVIVFKFFYNGLGIHGCSEKKCISGVVIITGMGIPTGFGVGLGMGRCGYRYRYGYLNLLKTRTCDQNP